MENSIYESMEKEQLIKLLQEKEEKKRIQNAKSYEKIKDKLKEQYEAKKEYYNCDCGSKVLITSKSYHLISDKHKRNLANKDVRKEILKPKPTCRFCKKSLVAYGTRRKNGADRLDYDDRPYHLKCYKELEVLETLKCIVEKHRREEQEENA